MPAEHAPALGCGPDAASFTGGLAALTAFAGETDRLAEEFTTARGIPWGAHEPTLHSGVADFFGAAYEGSLLTEWVPALGVEAALTDGARVVDVGCGHGNLIWFFDVLHDLGDPVRAATVARERLAAGGTVAVVEPFAVTPRRQTCATTRPRCSTTRPPPSCASHTRRRSRARRRSGPSAARRASTASSARRALRASSRSRPHHCTRYAARG